MASATRRRRHRYLGAPWPRGSGSQKSTKMERTKRSKIITEDSKRSWILPLMLKPNGRWSYRFGKMRQAIKKGRL